MYAPLLHLSFKRGSISDVDVPQIVVEATGSPKILEDAINYVRRGGKLVVYGQVILYDSHNNH